MTDQAYMQRCIRLALKGAGHVAPNPMVGAVLVHEGRIIGEGWHELYGGPHAEVNCILSVADADHALIPHSILYVSLEPCAHHGKTPPCADLIIAHRIPKVVVGSQDPFPDVNGKGIAKLRAAGVEVVTGVEEQDCHRLNKRFFTFHQQHRPYVILKWAETADGFLAANDHQRLLITGELSNRLVHQWRSEEASILVGRRTAAMDNPALSNRLWTGGQPVRLVVDMDLQLPMDLKLFDRTQPTVVFNAVKQEQYDNLQYYLLHKEADLLPQLLEALYALKLQSVLVEGGAMLLQMFISHGTWDEIRVLRNTELNVMQGLRAPSLPPYARKENLTLATDLLTIYYPS